MELIFKVNDSVRLGFHAGLWETEDEINGQSSPLAKASSALNLIRTMSMTLSWLILPTTAERDSPNSKTSSWILTKKNRYFLEASYLRFTQTYMPFEVTLSVSYVKLRLSQTNQNSYFFGEKVVFWLYRKKVADRLEWKISTFFSRFFRKGSLAALSSKSSSGSSRCSIVCVPVMCTKLTHSLSLSYTHKLTRTLSLSLPLSLVSSHRLANCL